MPDLTDIVTNQAGYPTVGILLATILYGVVCAQACYYFSNYSRDPLWLRALIAILWIADTLKECSAVQILWSLLVRYHGLPARLYSVPTGYIIEQIVDFIESCIVQCYYIYISWKLGPLKWYHQLLCIIATLLSVTTLGCVCAAMYYLNVDTSDIAALERLGKISIASNVFSLLTDIYIAVTLSLVFQRARIPAQMSELESNTSRSETILSKLTFYTVNRGIVLCLHQVVCFATYLWDYKTGTQVTEVFSFARGSLYLNAFLAVLNARHHISESGMLPSISVSSFVVRRGDSTTRMSD